MSVANSLIKPTYPPQPTQAGFTVVSAVGSSIATAETEIVRTRLTPGVWLLTACFNVGDTVTSIPFQFGVRLDGLPYNSIRFYETSTESGQSYNMTTPILVLETIDALINASAVGQDLPLIEGTLVQFTRLS